MGRQFITMKTLYNTVQQYESILDPNQDQVMNRMTDDAENIIRQRIQEYCTYDRQKYNRGELWPAADPRIKITKIDKDKQGWYIETAPTVCAPVLYQDTAKSFYDYCISQGQKIDEQKGFLIEDIGVYFRWRKHNNGLKIVGISKLRSTDGLPEELNALYLYNCCTNSKRLEVRNKINVIVISDSDDLKISGDGCKNVIIRPDFPCGNITAPNGVRIHRPKDASESWDLINKLMH